MNQRKIIEFLATGFFSGYARFASGTAGTLVALVLYAFLFRAFPLLSHPGIAILAALALTGFSIFIANQALELGLFELGEDPGEIVIDEFAGAFVALIGTSGDLRAFITAFILFRFFDILKPPPIKRLEKLPRGTGIVLDDVGAGVYASIIAIILEWVF